MKKNGLWVIAISLPLLCGCNSGVKLKTVSVNHDEIGTIGIPLEWEVELKDGWNTLIHGDSAVAVERFFGKHYSQGSEIYDTRVFNPFFETYFMNENQGFSRVLSNSTCYTDTYYDHLGETVHYWTLWLLGDNDYQTEFVFVDKTIEKELIEQIAKSYDISEANAWS